MEQKHLLAYTVSGTEFDPTAANDNCGITLTTYELSGATTVATTTGTSLAGVVFNKGVTTVKWTVTDAAGLSADCSFTVTVNDDDAPTITCKSNKWRNTEDPACTYTASGTEFDPSATNDNCGITGQTYELSGATTVAATSASSLAGVVFNKGLTVVKWTVTDAAGLSADCSFNVTVTDDDNPTISCVGNQTRGTEAPACTYTASGTEFDPTAANDNCGITLTTYELSGATTVATTTGTSLAGVVFNKGVTTVKWTVTDAAGLSADCSFTVTVNDDDAPTITCKSNKWRNTEDPACTYTASGTEFDPSATNDNCGITGQTYELSGATTVAATSASSLAGVVFNKGLTVVKWTVTDAAGLSADCSFNVTVTDDDDPTITCVGNQTRGTEAPACTYTASGAEFDPTAANDNCGITLTTYELSGATVIGTTTGTSLAGVTFNKGVTTVKWTVTDAAGLSADCSFTVTVNDDDVPTITCKSNKWRNTEDPACTYTASGTEFDPSATNDNCGITGQTYELSGATTVAATSASSLAGVVFNKGLTVVKWTVTDAAGLSADCSFNVTVTDDDDPTISCVANQIRGTQAPACTYTASGAEFDPTAANDNCGITLTTYELSGATVIGTTTGTSLAGVIFNNGVTTVKWTVTDAAGLSADCSFTVTVDDNVAPSLSCPTPITTNICEIAEAAPYANYAAFQTAGGSASDNCGIDPSSFEWVGDASNGQTCPEIITRTYRIRDLSGNPVTCTQNITVSCCAGIGDFVWDDLNRDGLQDAGEPGVPGVVVRLYDGSGAFQGSDVTDANGYYEFNGLFAQSYYLRFSNLPQYYIFTTQHVGAVDTIDSDPDPLGETVIFSLAPRQQDHSQDAGIYIPPATLGDRVWNDLIPNGQQNPGEPGVQGVIVDLYDASNTWVARDTTDANGNYLFTELMPGNYHLAFSNLPPSWIFSPKHAAGYAADSDVNPATGLTDPFFLAPGQVDPNRDAGIFLPEASVGDYVWFDDNFNGCQDIGEVGASGVKVILYDQNGVKLDSTTTDAQGHYLFSSLFPDDYRLGFENLPIHHVFAPKDNCNDDVKDSDVNPNSGLTDLINLWAGENEVNVDVGIMLPPTSISGRVWHDLNQDGIQDAGEPGIPNVIVFLYDLNNLPVNYTTTDALGYYIFPLLNTPWNYFVHFSSYPAGFVFSPKDQGFDDSKDSDVHSSGATDLHLLGVGSALVLDAGMMSPGTQLQLQVQLEGAYDTLTSLMRDDLRIQNLLPVTEPFTSMGYTHVQGGGEQTNYAVLSRTGSNAIVDWVLIELRDASDSTQVVLSRAALLQRDGDIVETDGISPLTITTVPNGNYYIVVSHRNHLGVMSAQSQAFTGGIVSIDFSDSQQAIFGSGGRKLMPNGRALLYGGDADGNGQVQNSDDVFLWVPQTGQSGYKPGDYDLDGQVQNSDHVYYWQENSGRGSSVPR